MTRLSKMKRNLLNIDLPIIGGVLMAYTATVFFQNVHNWNLVSISEFSIVIALHMVMYLFREQIFKERLWIYFLVQGVIIFALSIIIKENYQAAYLGLFPLIISQCIHLLKDMTKVLYTTIFYYCIYGFTVIIYNGYNDLLPSISLLILISSAISAYGYLYTRQVRAHEKTQTLFLELEEAYDKMEEMARDSERQKLARDIHDTLSQGLSGVLMKLEALEVNLDKGNIEKSMTITKDTIVHVRDTLGDSREIIRDLRVQQKELQELSFALEKEIDQFKRDTKTELIINHHGNVQVTNMMYKNISYIVREALANIKKHAKATKVVINSSLEKEKVIIRIEDNGIGFDYLHFNRIYGHYGILGMQERAKAIKGKLLIESRFRSGTCITLIVPLEMSKAWRQL